MLSASYTCTYTIGKGPTSFYQVHSLSWFPHSPATSYNKQLFLQINDKYNRHLFFVQDTLLFFFFFFLFNLTYSRWTSLLPSCLWSLRISHLSPVHAFTIFYRDASSALLQLVKQWLNFTYSRSHAFRYERKNTNLTLVRIELTTSALAGVQVTY